MKASAGDKAFVAKAAMGGTAEVQASQAAQQKGSSDAVKQFAAKMIDDHTKANDELKQIAGSKGMNAPAALDAKHQAAMSKMQAMSGDAFDRAYMKQMIADHKETIALFQKESKSGSDADLKAFATKTMPTLQEHLKMAQDSNDSMVKAGKTDKSAM